MKEMILIRHGQSQSLVSDLTGGWTDSPLTELGRRQAQRTAARLSRLLSAVPFELFCSDFQRTRETAEIISQAVRRQPVIAPQLRDVNNGIAANRTKMEAEKLRLPVTVPLMDWVPFPEAESWRMMQQRAAGFLEGLDLDVAVLVTHRNVISAVIQWWLGMDDKLISSTDFEAEPGSLAFLTTAPAWGGRVLYKLNDTAHLEGLGE